MSILCTQFKDQCVFMRSSFCHSIHGWPLIVIKLIGNYSQGLIFIQPVELIGQEFYFRIVLWNIQSILSGGSLSRPIWTYLTSLFRSLGGLVASVEMDLIETGAGSWWNLILPSLLCLLTVRRVSETAQAPLGPRLLVCKLGLGVWNYSFASRRILRLLTIFSKKCSVIAWNW